MNNSHTQCLKQIGLDIEMDSLVPSGILEAAQHLDPLKNSWMQKFVYRSFLKEWMFAYFLISASEFLRKAEITAAMERKEDTFPESMLASCRLSIDEEEHEAEHVGSGLLR